MMKNLGILIFTALLLSACQTSNIATSAYDDVYYTPKSSNGKSEMASQQKSTTDLNYGNNASGERFQQTADPEVKYVESQDNPADNSAAYSTEALPAPANESSNEYYYVEDGDDDYYDYDYASRIQRFNGSCYDCGYYSPIYSGMGYSPYYGSGFSAGYGWGMPYYGFSMSFGYGMGYPYYYNPWYYDPWYSWNSYPYYGGGSYWAGYNNGFWNGYYSGGGGYYQPGSDYNAGSYYGPRTSRSGSQISQGGESRESRVGEIDDQNKNTNSYSTGRESRIGGSETMGGAAAKTTTTPENGRPSRNIQPQQINGETIGNSGGAVQQEISSEKLAKPEDGSRNTRNNAEVESQKISKPAVSSQEVGNSQRNTRSQESISGGTKYAKPAVNNNESSVYSRDRKYAKPNSAEVQRSSQPKNYNAPNYNKPRSSNEYTVPNSRNATRTNPQPAGTNTRNSNIQSQPDKSRNYYTPSKSNNSFSTPSRSNNNTVSPAKSGGGTSTPSRSSGGGGSSYTTPSRSSGGSSTPARSSGSSVSPSGGSGRSSGSSSGGSSSGSSSGKSSGGSSGGSGRRIQ